MVLVFVHGQDTIISIIIRIEFTTTLYYTNKYKKKNERIDNYYDGVLNRCNILLFTLIDRGVDGLT